MGTEKQETLKQEFGRRLKAVRESRGLTQLELRNRTGLNAWRLENGQIDPSYTSLHNIARALGVAVEELIKEEQ
jgi:transcriptional regulator with XRE-family HTH domain